MSASLSDNYRNVAAEEALETKNKEQRPTTDRPYTRRNKNNIIHVSTVAVSKFVLNNARSLWRKSLFVRNYIDQWSRDIVALTEIWLTDEHNISVSELCRNNFMLVHQPRGGAFRHSKNARTGCMRRVLVIYRPANSCFGLFLDDVSKMLLIGDTQCGTVTCATRRWRYSRAG